MRKRNKNREGKRVGKWGKSGKEVERIIIGGGGGYYHAVNPPIIKPGNM